MLHLPHDVQIYLVQNNIERCQYLSVTVFVCCLLIICPVESGGGGGGGGAFLSGVLRMLSTANSKSISSVLLANKACRFWAVTAWTATENQR